jgi:NADH dehydrogenase (ubiquinone) 1 alpha subcomplex subunit 9
MNVNRTITMFGADSVLGNPTTFALAPAGNRIIVPFNDDGYMIRPNKMAGKLGQVIPQPYSMFDEDSIRRTMEETDLVINLIGSFKDTRHYTVREANLNTAIRVAKIAKEMGVNRMIHVSASGAALDAPSEFQRVKYESELAVKSYFPNASIIRPTQMFNEDDAYLHAVMANIKHKYGKYITFSEGRVQPIFVRDVALAIAQIADNPQIDGQTWTLGGTKSFTRAELYYHLVGMIRLEQVKAEVMTNEDSIRWSKFMKRFPFFNKFYQNIPNYAPDYFAADTTVAASAPTKGLAELGIPPTEFDHILLKMAHFHMSEVSQALQPSSLWNWKPMAKFVGGK